MRTGLGSDFIPDFTAGIFDVWTGFSWLRIRSCGVKMVIVYTVSPFYCVPGHSSFIAWKAFKRQNGHLVPPGITTDGQFWYQLTDVSVPEDGSSKFL